MTTGRSNNTPGVVIQQYCTGSNNSSD